jgi:hypothetical protein
VSAGIAANNAGQGTIMAALQCLFYPVLIPVMRYQVRRERNIEVTTKASKVYINKRNAYFLGRLEPYKRVGADE